MFNEDRRIFTKISRYRLTISSPHPKKIKVPQIYCNNKRYTVTKTKYDITFPVVTARRCVPWEPSSFPNLQKKIYSNIHEKYSPVIFVYVFWLPSNFMKYARVLLYKFMLLHTFWSHLTARRVSKSDMPTTFTEKCLLQFIQNKKIIGGCNLLLKLQDTCL